MNTNPVFNMKLFKGSIKIKRNFFQTVILVILVSVLGVGAQSTFGRPGNGGQCENEFHLPTGKKVHLKPNGPLDNYPAARQYCNWIGMRVVLPKNEQENKQLSQIAKQNYFRTGFWIRYGIGLS